VFEQSWDDAEPEDTRVLTLVSAGRRCSVHSGISSVADNYATVVEENRFKNRALLLAQGRRAALGESDYVWSFSGTGRSRVLAVRLRGITAAERNNIQSDLDAEFGAGKTNVIRA
jgi:hypothetical protein